MNSRLSFAVCLCLSWVGILLAPAAEIPQLSVTNQATNLVVSWPDAGQWVLEESTNLQAPLPWSLVSPAFYQSNAISRFVSFSTNSGNRFFRLRKTGLTVPGLRGYWSLDEGAGQTSSDGSESGSALLITNASWGTGRLGPGALQFTGSPTGPEASRAWVSNDDYRVLPPYGSPFSISLWFNPDALLLGWSAIAGNNATGTNGWQLALNNAGPGTNFFVLTSAGLPNSLSITGRFLLLPGQWHQLTVTHDGTEGSIYIDSAQLARGSGPLSTHEGPVYFGGGVGGYNSFLGRIDDLRLYTNSLSFEQISLAGYWPFDETNGLICADSSLQGHSAVVTNASARVAAHDGMGIDLSQSQIKIGNEDYAVLPPLGGSFSLSFYLRPNSLEPGWSSLMKLGEGPIGGWELTVLGEGSGKTSLHLSATNAGGTLDLLAPVPLNTTSWTKIDITFNGGIATLYANGKQMRVESGAIRGTKSPLLIGATPTLPACKAVIDDLKIYSRERGPSEIGPIANTMWETVMLNSSTNMQLQGDGPAGKSLTYTLVPVLTPTNGTVALNGNTFTYTASSRKGPDAFTYTVSDGEFTSDPAIVTMSVVQPHYLSPTGGYLEPQDGSTLLQAWMAGPADAMDAILKTNNYYDCFFYAPGEYQTRGLKVYQRSTANPGCKHIGSASSGAKKTTIQLVDVWGTWDEGVIFGSADANTTLADNFEIHHMVLDCNATNVPQYVKGEPFWIRIPLVDTSRVDKVILQWDDSWFYGTANWRLGQASEFRLQARRRTNNGWVTNTFQYNSTGHVDVADIGIETDELLLQLDRRAPGIDFYGISEIQVLGATVSLPQAMSTNGLESRLTPEYAAVFMTDNNPDTAWAGGPEGQVQLSIPLAPGTTLSQVTLQWNCKNVPGLGRLGPAATFLIRARNEATGQFEDVPFTTQGRSSTGLERCIFGAAQALVTDRLLVLLTSREAGVDFYSLSEISMQNGATTVQARTPIAQNSFPLKNLGVEKAFDHNGATQWASGTQGMLGAVNAIGSNIKFIDLSVIGFGTKAARECFPILVGAVQTQTTRYLGNVVVQDCIISEPAPENHDGATAIVLGAIPPNIISNTTVRRCTVKGLKSHFTYSQGMSAVQVENCRVDDCEKAVYFEPYYGQDNIGAVTIRSNEFYNVNFGVYLLMWPGTRFGPLTFLGNEMVMSGLGGWAFASCDTCMGGPSGSIESVTALNNVIRFPAWEASPPNRSGGMAYNDIHHAVFGNNTLALTPSDSLRVRAYPAGIIYAPTPKEDCDHPGPFPPGEISYPPSLDILPLGYKRAWFNNCDLSGTVLNVRFSNLGTDVPALQQQWTD